MPSYPFLSGTPQEPLLARPDFQHPRVQIHMYGLSCLPHGFPTVILKFQSMNVPVSLIREGHLVPSVPLLSLTLHVISAQQTILLRLSKYT